MWVLASNIAIGVYVLDMWSVLCIWVVGLYCTYWTCGHCCLSDMQVVGSNIAIGLCIMDMWSVLCVPNVGGGI